MTSTDYTIDQIPPTHAPTPAQTGATQLAATGVKPGICGELYLIRSEAAKPLLPERLRPLEAEIDALIILTKEILAELDKEAVPHTKALTKGWGSLCVAVAVQWAVQGILTVAAIPYASKLYSKLKELFQDKKSPALAIALTLVPLWGSLLFGLLAGGVTLTFLPIIKRVWQFDNHTEGLKNITTRKQALELDTFQNSLRLINWLDYQKAAQQLTRQHYAFQKLSVRINYEHSNAQLRNVFEQFLTDKIPVTDEQILKQTYITYTAQLKALKASNAQLALQNWE